MKHHSIPLIISFFVGSLLAYFGLAAWVSAQQYQVEFSRIGAVTEQQEDMATTYTKQLDFAAVNGVEVEVQSSATYYLESVITLYQIPASVDPVYFMLD